MSHVRMCDRCGNIFSENEENWSTQTASVMRRDDETGRQRTVEISQDTCPKCTGRIFKPVKAKIRGVIDAAPVEDPMPSSYAEYLETKYKARHSE